jgi:hypothetical protein
MSLCDKYPLLLQQHGTAYSLPGLNSTPKPKIFTSLLFAFCLVFFLGTPSLAFFTFSKY